MLTLSVVCQYGRVGTLIARVPWLEQVTVAQVDALQQR